MPPQEAQTHRTIYIPVCTLCMRPLWSYSNPNDLASMPSSHIRGAIPLFPFASASPIPFVNPTDPYPIPILAGTAGYGEPPAGGGGHGDMSAPGLSSSDSVVGHTALSYFPCPPSQLASNQPQPIRVLPERTWNDEMPSISSAIHMTAPTREGYYDQPIYNQQFLQLPQHHAYQYSPDNRTDRNREQPTSNGRHMYAPSDTDPTSSQYLHHYHVPRDSSGVEGTRGDQVQAGSASLEDGPRSGQNFGSVPPTQQRYSNYAYNSNVQTNVFSGF